MFAPLALPKGSMCRGCPDCAVKVLVMEVLLS